MSVKGGPGVRVRQYPGQHFTVSASGPPVYWRPAWPVYFNGADVAVGFGMVNEIEPRIGGIRISGRDDKGVLLPTGQPRLRLLPDYDSEGRQWVCVRVKVKSDGRIDAKDKEAVTCVVVKDLLIASLGGDFRGQVGLHPLALFRKSGEWFPVTYFHLQHRVAKGKNVSGAEVARHFFWPV